MEITYIHEPTDLQCGQAVLAMVLGMAPEEICRILGNDRETCLREMKALLTENGVAVSQERRPFTHKEELPELALLSLETPRCWHWSLYFRGKFYDPEHGVSQELTACSRRYFWELSQSPLTEC
ncbi:MAG: hypothetical protein J6M48_08980 [Ruminococcus sp.]|nr:hypothetical protein [Ruminococcus sp.]